jgi:hypothetical protein
MSTLKHLKHLLLLIFLAAESALAQSDRIDSTSRAIESMFESGSYVNAEVEARRLLEWPNVADSARVVAEKWIGFSLVAQGKSFLARDHFVALLRLNPQFELDPILTSPKILAVFNEAKTLQTVHAKLVRDTVITRSLRQSLNVSFRTIIFPGWEQLHTNRATTGYLFLGGGIGTLGAGIVFDALRSSARSKYLSASSPQTIESEYSRYDKYYKSEIYAFSAFVIVYLASEIDVFDNADSYSLSFRPLEPSSRGSSISLLIRF